MEQLAGYLSGVASGAELACPPKEHPGFAPLLREAKRTAHVLASLRANSAEKQRFNEFVQDLAEALELADDEVEVIDTAERAAGVAFPGREVRVLLADNSHSAMELRGATTEPLCDPRTPSRCPAVRRSRMEQHEPEAGLSRCPHLRPTDSHVACAFVAVNGRSAGALQVSGAPLDADGHARLRAMAHAVGTRLDSVRTLGQREIQAATDVLTGLANRRRMNEQLAALDRSDGEYAIIAADLDHFKKLNDTFGHEVGDQCLKVFAQVLRDSIREGDLPCRPGGEEFVVILQGADARSAEPVAERIRRNLNRRPRFGNG